MVKLRHDFASVLQTNLTAPVTHFVVQTGDSLWSIANQLHTTVAALESLNNLTSTVIYAGSQLIVPLNEESKEVADVGTVTGSVSHSSSSGTQSSPLAVSDSTIVPVPSSANIATPKVDYSQEDVNLLAHLVQAEAGTQPLLGQVAVGAVVVNRLKDPAFPKTLAAVIEQPGQFESVTNGTFWQPPSASAIVAAQDALQGWDPTAGALFYYNPNLPHSPWMNTLVVTATIGSQVFCR